MKNILAMDSKYTVNFFNKLTEEESAPEAVLAAVFPKGGDTRAAEASLAELERLLETAGGRVFARVVQNKEAPDHVTYLGSGKIEELRRVCETGAIGLVVFDAELTPSQIRNIEAALDGVSVIDRSMLILDIFALHAATSEGKLQVELAQLKYTAPRLAGKGKALSRLGGGIGTRGPGESKLETDRRHLARRIAALEAELDALRRGRELRRRQRERAGVYRVAVAGYTNAGKSTLLNALTGAGLLAEDKLFATLDPTTRRFTLPGGSEILLTDTVGFIRNLPTHLIRAFRSTLEEVAYADCILLLIDASDPESAAQLKVTEDLLQELGAGDKPILYVLNKCDLAQGLVLPPLASSGDGKEKREILFISAKTGEGLETLAERLESMATEKRKPVTFFFPAEKLGFLDLLYKSGAVTDVVYENGGATVRTSADEKLRGQLHDYLVEKKE